MRSIFINAEVKCWSLGSSDVPDFKAGSRKRRFARDRLRCAVRANQVGALLAEPCDRFSASQSEILMERAERKGRDMGAHDREVPMDLKSLILPLKLS